NPPNPHKFKAQLVAQGKNSSVQDSMNLGWKLALVEKGLAPHSLLDTYTAERLPVIASMLGKTTELLNNTYKSETANSGLGRPFELRQFGTNYRGSSIVLDEKNVLSTEGVDPYRSGLDGILRAGDRAPDAPQLMSIVDREDTSLFEIFKVSYHTILVFPLKSSSNSFVEEVAVAATSYPEVKTVVVYHHLEDAQESAGCQVLWIEVVMLTSTTE
ncbi:hypothetical protein MPER_12415, partial [Moniliophthora perniciosa FA553]